MWINKNRKGKSKMTEERIMAEPERVDYTTLLEQKVIQVKAEMKRQRRRKGFCFFANDLLPNYRTAEKCCATCWMWSASYEGEGDCNILYEISKENDSVFSRVTDTDVCDFWEEERS